MVKMEPSSQALDNSLNHTLKEENVEERRRRERKRRRETGWDEGMNSNEFIFIL